jgi:hypothetical protein
MVSEGDPRRTAYSFFASFSQSSKVLMSGPPFFISALERRPQAKRMVSPEIFVAAAHESGYVSTILGRKRYIPARQPSLDLWARVR